MEVRRVPLRRLSVVIDLQDLLSPPMPLDDYVKTYGSDPPPDRYRVVDLEVLVCPEDGNAVLASECAKCPRFVRRYRDEVHCVGVGRGEG
ncbi:hypothetical protein B6U99_04605 [Candidatus Geothermarchaeota archaeon ex4572_27]|nr:MAG: hypothetical protein B6U99_04605 [Candidatus Geothermarchaeota archaeon ex4572_27]